MQNKKNNIEVIGHRGNLYKKVENTFEGIESAFNAAHGCEVDVQLSKDKELILYHDDYLGGAGFIIVNETLNFITEYSIDDLKKTVFHREKLELELSTKAQKKITLDLKSIPIINNLDDTLPILKNKKLFIELKCNKKSINYKNELAKKIVDWIKKNNVYEEVVIISFEKDILNMVKELDEKIKLGLDLVNSHEKNITEELTFKNNKKMDFILIPFKEVNKKILDECKTLNVEVYTWVWKENIEEEINEFKRLVTLDIKGIITNQPEELMHFIKTSC